MQFLTLGLAVVQGFLLTPAALRHIDYKLYGAWLATGQMLSWVSLLDPGVNEILRQRVAFAFGGSCKDGLGAILGSGLIAGFFIAVIPAVAGLGAALIAPHFISLNQSASVELQHSLIAATGAMGLTIASFSPGSALQGLQRHVLHGTVSLLGAATYLIAALVLLYHGWGLLALPTALLIRSAIWIVGWTLPLLWIAQRELRVSIRPDWAEGKQTLGMSAATGLSNIASTVQTNTDVFIAGAMIGPESAATLSLTGALSDFIRLVPDRIVASFLPGLAHLAGEGDLVKFRAISWRLVQAIVAVLSLAIGSVVIVNEVFVKRWVGARSYGGLALTACLCISVVLFSSCNLFSVILFSKGIIKPTSLVRLAQAASQILLVLVFIHQIRLLAIPIALALAAALGLTTFFIRTYSATIGASEEPWREQWKWFWLPLLGSIGLATGLALAFRPQTIPAAILVSILYWILDGTFLLAVNASLRAEARLAFSQISTFAGLFAAR